MLDRALSSLRTNILTGILVLAPFGAVLGVIMWIWGWLVSFAELIPESLHPQNLFHLENAAAIQGFQFLYDLVVVAVVLWIVWLTGLISRNYLGKQLLDKVSGYVSRVPVLSTIYSTLEQLLQTFSSDKSKNFRRVVWIEYPRSGILTLALVTGERDKNPITKAPMKMLKIFVPTTPNPTSGFYLTVSEDQVIDAQISVEEALKEIISMGIASGDRK